MKRRQILTCLAAVTICLWGTVAHAEILSTDEISDEDRYATETTAVIDTEAREIRLPEAAPTGTAGLLDGRPESLGVATVDGESVASYSFDGTTLQRNPSLSRDALMPSPLGVAARASETDLVVLTDDAAIWYSHTGAFLRPNSWLSIMGLSEPVQVALRPGSTDMVVLDGTTIRSFSFDGQSLRESNALSVSGLISPIAFALAPRTLDLVVLDDTTAKYFAWTGSGYRFDANRSVSGLDQAVAVQFTGDMLFVLESDGLKTFLSDGQQMRPSNTHGIPEAAGGLSIAVLAEGTVAVRFPSEIRFYQWTGSAYRENTGLRVSGLAPPGTGESAEGYVPSAMAIAKPVGVAAAPVEALVLEASEERPPGTNILYKVSADAGETWLPATLGRGVLISRGTEPSTWAATWQATLSTTDPGRTPRILPLIRLLQVWRPDPPSDLMVTPRDADGIVRTVVPTLSWSFSDPDEWRTEGDYQTGYQVVIYDRATGDPVYNSGKISSLSDASPPPDEPGPVPLTIGDARGGNTFITLPMGALRGTASFAWRVRVWDRYDLVSEWSPYYNMDVLALYNLRITDIVNPPDDPPPSLPTNLLPINVKAGARFSFAVDSLGPFEVVNVILSDGGATTLWPRSPAGSVENSWDGSYFTEPTVPTGTVIQALFTGETGEGRSTTLAADLVRIEGSIYDDYVVILKDPSEGEP